MIRPITVRDLSATARTFVRYDAFVTLPSSTTEDGQVIRRNYLRQQYRHARKFYGLTSSEARPFAMGKFLTAFSSELRLQKLR